MKFENGLRYNETIVTGSVDEFRFVWRAASAEWHAARIGERRLMQVGGSSSGALGQLVAKLDVALRDASEEQAVERTVVLDYDEVENAHLSLANAADAVGRDNALYGRIEGELVDLEVGYRSLAQHWKEPAGAARPRAIRG